MKGMMGMGVGVDVGVFVSMAMGVGYVVIINADRSPVKKEQDMSGKYERKGWLWIWT